jgi:hypothetical protein
MSDADLADAARKLLRGRQDALTRVATLYEADADDEDRPGAGESGDPADRLTPHTTARPCF